MSTNPVYDRAYAQNRADGSAAPTLNYMNPQWARFYDQLKQASGGKQPLLGGGVGQSLPKFDTPADPAAVEDDTDITSPTDPVAVLRRALGVK